MNTQGYLSHRQLPRISRSFEDVLKDKSKEPKPDSDPSPKIPRFYGPNLSLLAELVRP